MATQTSAETQKKLELRSKALTANIEEVPHFKDPLIRLDALLVLLKDLTAQQASLTASKQEVSKRLAELLNEGQKLLTFIDVGVRQHYGNRSEKLVEFGLQPFRSQPRLRLVGEDGKPLKKKGAPQQEPPAPPQSE